MQHNRLQVSIVLTKKQAAQLFKTEESVVEDMIETGYLECESIGNQLIIPISGLRTTLKKLMKRSK
jgi:hypothetical protein